MRSIGIVGRGYAAMHEWLSGRPSMVLSAFLIMYAIFLVGAAFRLSPEAKTILLAWAILP